MANIAPGCDEFLTCAGAGADPYDTVLPAALEGFLPSNFHMQDHQEFSHPAMRRDLEAGSATRPKRRIHCVLFFFPYAALGSEASYGTLRKAFQRVRRQAEALLQASCSKAGTEPAVRGKLRALRGRVQVKRRGYNPLVLVTMLDQEDSAIRHKPLPADLAIKHPKVEEALKEVGCLLHAACLNLN